MKVHEKCSVLCAVVLTGAFGFFLVAEAAEREVCPSGCAYASIQGAIDASADGDAIVVHEGTYGENINIDKALSITSLAGPATTILEGQGASPCIAIAGPGGVTLAGFTIRGGKAGRFEPSGIYIAPEVTDARISECVISGNDGTGIFNDSGRFHLEDSVVADNRPGPGLFLSGEHNRLESSRVAGNEDSGIVLAPYSDLAVVNSTITGNQAFKGGGLTIGSHSSLRLTHSTVAGNRGGNREFSGGGVLLYGANLVVVLNSIIWGNHPYAIQRQDDADLINVLYSDMQDFDYLFGKARGEGVIQMNPAFVDPRSADAAPTSEGDYHLRRISPCIDSGTSAVAVYQLPDDDMDGQLRPQGGAFDMGADEFYLGGNVEPLPDIAVNGSDVTTVSQTKGETVFTSIGMKPGSSAGVEGDWWIVVRPPFPYPVFSIMYEGRNWKKGVHVSREAALEEVLPYMVLRAKSSRMPLGVYTFYFGVDVEMNGSLDWKKLFLDAAYLRVLP